MSHSGFPELRMPSALPVSARFRVSPVALAPSCNACDTDLRLPLVLYLRLSPAMDRRVASILTSFGGAGCESSRLPLCFAPPVSPTIRFRVAPVPHLRYRLITAPSHLGSRAIRFASLLPPDCSGCPRLASPPDRFSSRPESFVVRRRRFRLSRVAPKRSSSADPHLLPQVAPASASTAGSMITPWLNRTLHPRLAPRMNLRLQSGTNIPDLASSALSISINPSAIGRTANFKLKPLLALFTSRSCCSNQLQSHQLVRDSRPDRSVDASAKP